MDRRTFLRSTSVAATVGLASFAGCTGGDGGDGDGGSTDGGNETDGEDGGVAGQPGENRVAMVTEDTTYYFDPIGLFVESGTTVTFDIESGAHSSTAYFEDYDLADATRIPMDAEPWDSGTISGSGTTFEHTFETAGTYDYYCIPHKTLGMVGRIVVDEPGGPAEGSMPPDGQVPQSETVVEQGAVPYEEFSG